MTEASDRRQPRNRPPSILLEFGEAPRFSIMNADALEFQALDLAGAAALFAARNILRLRTGAPEGDAA